MTVPLLGPGPAGARRQGGTAPLLWRADAAGQWQWSSDEWSAFTDLSGAASLGFGWLKAIHPGDRLAARRLCCATPPAGTAILVRLREASAKRHRGARLSASPDHDTKGALSGWIGAVCLDSATDTDIAVSRKVAEDLEHHLRNTLAVIRSMVRRTARTSETVEHYAAHIEGRLDAMARVQNAILRAPDRGVDLHALLVDELAAQQVDDDRVRIGGPPLWLSGRAAEMMGLALHELATNAVKFGPFGSGRGWVEIRWEIDADGDSPMLDFEWRETGVAVLAAAPQRVGFGTEMIEKSLAYELGATADLAFAPGGVVCRIAVPLSATVGPSAATIGRGAATGGSLARR